MLQAIRRKLVQSVDRFPRLAWVSRSWFNFIFREKELHLLRRIGRSHPGRVVGIDVGANTGVYSYFMSKFCALTLSFEPNRILQPYWDNNYAPRVLPIKAAVGSSSDDITLYSPNFDNPDAAIHGLSSVISKNIAYDGASVVQETVPQVMLNELEGLMRVMNAKLVIAKIDVEGYELEVLNGAGRIIELYEPVFIIEIEVKHNPRYAEVFNFLADRGYSSYFYNRSRLEGCGQEMCERQSTVGKNNRYINNFIFMKLDNSNHADIESFINGSTCITSPSCGGNLRFICLMKSGFGKMIYCVLSILRKLVHPTHGALP